MDSRRVGAHIQQSLIFLFLVVIQLTLPRAALGVPTPDDPLQVIAPPSLTTLDSAPVEIVLDVHATARVDTFKAKLNGQDITALFVQTGNELRASVSWADGIKAGIEGVGRTRDSLNKVRIRIRGDAINRPSRILHSFFVTLPAGSTSPLNPAAIVMPEEMQVLDATPVDIFVELHETAQVATFKAKLNGNNISTLFNAVEGGLAASVGVEHGLIVAVDGDGTAGGNVLTTRIRGTEISRDRDTRTFFVITQPDINHPPVADAGLDRTAHIGDVVTPDGSASFDPDGDPITYLWHFVSVPADSIATFSDPMVVDPSFEIDAHGDYVVQLVVNDGELDSSRSEIGLSLPVHLLHNYCPPGIILA